MATLRRIVDGRFPVDDASPKHISLTDLNPHHRPLSMLSFCNLFRYRMDDTPLTFSMSSNRYIWVNYDAFVRYDGKYASSSQVEKECKERGFVPSLQQFTYILILGSEDDELYFYIHAVDKDAADSCLEFLFSLEDTYFARLLVSRQHSPYYSLPSRTQKRSAHRINPFYELELTCAQQRMIVAASKRTLLTDCRFCDGGTAILTVLLETGLDFEPVDLYMEGDCPFDDNCWNQFLNLLVGEKKLVKKLDISKLTLRPTCRTTELASARVTTLSFGEKLGIWFRYEIIESIRGGNSPEGLDFVGLDSRREWDDLCKSLASPQCQLKRLKILILTPKFIMTTNTK